MKILHTVKQYHPARGGMYEVVKQISEHLIGLGHSVTVATTKLPSGYNTDLKGVKIKEFDITGNFVSGMSGEVKKYQDFLINSDFDVITSFAAQQPMTDAMLLVLDKIKAKKVFVPTGFASFKVNEYQKYYKKMGDWFKEFDVNIFLSNDYQDINYARESGAKNIIVIPNGASSDEFSKNNNIDIRERLNIPKNDFLILLVGSHTSQKGHKEAMEIFSHSDIKNATLLIVGNKGKCSEICENQKSKINTAKESLIAGKKILIQQLDRGATVSAFETADLFLFPSNTECSPIVLFEAMASKTPFLVTDVGNAKEIIEWSGGGLLLPTRHGVNPEESLKAKIKNFLKKFLSGIIKLNKAENYNICRAEIKSSATMLENIYSDKEKRSSLAYAGYKSWQGRFTWEKIAREYERVYTKVTKQSS